MLLRLTRLLLYNLYWRQVSLKHLLYLSRIAYIFLILAVILIYAAFFYDPDEAHRSMLSECISLLFIQPTGVFSACLSLSSAFLGKDVLPLPPSPVRRVFNLIV